MTRPNKKWWASAEAGGGIGCRRRCRDERAIMPIDPDDKNAARIISAFTFVSAAGLSVAVAFGRAATRFRTIAHVRNHAAHAQDRHDHDRTQTHNNDRRFSHQLETLCPQASLIQFAG